MGWLAFSAALGGFLSLVFRYTYPNVNFEPEMDFIAGAPDDYDTGVDGEVEKIATASGLLNKRENWWPSPIYAPT